MNLRRYAPLKPSSGTVIPFDLRQHVLRRDRLTAGGNGCIGRAIGMPGLCGGSIELDHVRASHAMGRKSETSAGNLVSLCGAHHRVKTEDGRFWRLRLLEYLERVEGLVASQ